MDAVKEVTHTQAEMRLSRPHTDMLLVHLAGNWRLQRMLPSVAELQQQLEAGPSVQRLGFDTRHLTSWDSGLLTFVRQVVDLCTQHRIVLDQTGLPDGVRQLLALAAAVPERAGARRETVRDPFLDRISKATLALVESSGEMLGFMGDTFLAFLKLLRGRARFRPVDLWQVMQECGAHRSALPEWGLMEFHDAGRKCGAATRGIYGSEPRADSRGGVAEAGPRRTGGVRHPGGGRCGGRLSR